MSARHWRRAYPIASPIGLFGKWYGASMSSRSAIWRRIGALPRPVHAFGAVAFGGELWVLGGRRGERVLRDVWILDPATMGWRHGPTMPRGMELLGAATVGDEIHAVWESVYQVYDAGTGRWRQGPPPLVTRHALEAFVVDGSLYAVGGCTTALQDSPVVERLEVPEG